ncbi:MAG: DUF2512 family protein [Dethiobacter sp.]|jgi:uncharacterized protein YqgC (DUF456 family)|nr:DUF2512 family protein [Dethiobacter sp.]
MDRIADALLIKFTMTYLFTVLALQAFIKNPASWIFLLALAVTVTNYLVGDILVLSSYSNKVAAAGDGLMAALAGHIAGVVIDPFRTTLFALIIYGVLIAVGEYYFHKYLLTNRRSA